MSQELDVRRRENDDLTLKALTRLEGKVDQLLETKTDHEGRIRFLEKMNWVRTGAIAVISALLGYISLK